MRATLIFLLFFNLGISVVPCLAASSESTTPPSSKAEEAPLLSEAVAAGQTLSVVNRTVNHAAKSLGRSLGQYLRGQYQHLKNVEILERFDNALNDQLAVLSLNPEERNLIIQNIEQAYVKDAESGRLQLDQENFRDLPNLVRKEYSEILFKRTQDGVVDTYDSEGRLKTRWTLKDRQPHGAVTTFYQNGEIRYIDLYESGKKTNRKKYDKEGRLVFSENYTYEAPLKTITEFSHQAWKAQTEAGTNPPQEITRKIPVVFVEHEAEKSRALI